MAWRVWAWRVEAGRGTARQGVQWHGVVVQGLAWFGGVRHGEAGWDRVRNGEVRLGRVRLGMSRLGEVRFLHRGHMMNDMTNGAVIAPQITEPTNGGKQSIEAEFPYTVTARLVGVADLLFHRWNAEAVEQKAKAAKNSKAKKTDDVDNYVYRNLQGELCIPGEYVRQAIISAAKFRQDPRSPRKSAMDLYKAGVVCLTQLASVGKVQWDYLDTRRVVVQRSGINRTRPALRAGWSAEFQFFVTLPEYINPTDLQDVMQLAGRVIGLADFRPSYGRYNVTLFNASQAS